MSEDRLRKAAHDAGVSDLGAEWFCDCIWLLLLVGLGTLGLAIWSGTHESSR